MIYAVAFEIAAQYELSLTPANDVKKQNRCLGIENLNSYPGMEIESFIEQPDGNYIQIMNFGFFMGYLEFQDR